MGRIVLLDEITANKIAAGEVIERPASVVKELVENSIDAGSTRIEIAVIDGGLSSITVIDNGGGMDAEDARLAFERHATSKIRGADDLEKISSLGFRGEALPSVAAISRLSLKTRVKGAVSGNEVVIEGGKVRRSVETGCPPGTIIEVKDLFYNTPARKKHMKSPNTETGHISETVNKFAMGYPGISFQLKSNGRLILKTSGSGSLPDCVASVYGAEFARDMLPVEVHEGGTRIYGFVGKPLLSRSGRSHQTVYINGRFVRNRTVSDAVEKAYHGMLMSGRHPVFILNIEVNPEEVDVNVHPAKTEVRLAGPSVLGNLITGAVSGVLGKARLIPSAETAAKPTSRREANVKQQDITRQEELNLTYRIKTDNGKVHEPAPPIRPAESSGKAGVKEVPRTPETHAANEHESPVMAEAEAVVTAGFPELRPIGQIDLTYIVTQGPDGMYLVDQHAAHERVLYEKFMEKPEQFISGEQLLFPISVQLTHQEAQVLNDNIINLTDLGFVIEHFGGETFLIRAVPSGIAKNSGKEIFLDLLDYFSRERYTITSKALKEKLLVTMACKSAIKANQKLGLPEMESLIGQLAQCRNPYTCPHGRPTVIHFSGYDLEKRFKRVL